jgi:ribosome maturation factor RimP
MMAPSHPFHGIDRGALERVVEPIVCAHGAELVDIEFKPERAGWVLRVMVERQGSSEKMLSTRDAAINLELCSGISRDLSPALDVADLIGHPYHLEVGSPGVERPLITERDFVRFKGEKAKLKLHEPARPAGAAGDGPGQSVVIGTLAGVAEGRVRMEDGERTYEVTLANVDRARLVFEFGSSGGARSNRPGRPNGPSGTHKRKH